jgi:hydroxyacyl-ACP dehydratase HTD2-like protein with hotdog domain
VPISVSRLVVGEALPQRQFTATNVSLFLYNAAIWNPHRIHYDEAYTKKVEQHPGIVIDGPLQGDWLSQCVLNWIGSQGKLMSFHYRNRKAAYLGEVLTVGGTILSIEEQDHFVNLQLYVMNEKQEVITPGEAKVKIPG